jgi:hypothetical protein
VQDGPEGGDRLLLPRRDAGVVEAEEHVLVGEDVGVDQPPVRDAEVGVQPAGDARDLGVALAQGRVGEGDDVLGVDEGAERRLQDRRGAGAARAARGDAARALDVALLDVVDAGAVQRPARLLAEVADRDGDQPGLII